MSEADRKGGQPGSPSGGADDTAKLVEQLQVTNQLLRRQAIMIGLISFIALALMDLSQAQWDRNQALFHKIQLLENLRDAKDLRKHVETNWREIDSALMHDLDTDALLFELKQDNYSDRTPIVEAISQLKEKRRATWGISENTVSIMGVDIPIAFWFYLVPFIILLLFHNFTQIVQYRGNLIRKLGIIEDWKQGPYLAGFRQHPQTDAWGRYLQIISSFIAIGFLLFPLLVSFLFVMASYSLTTDFERAGTDIILALNWLCLCLLATDVLLILYQENILKFRSTLTWFTGTNSADSNDRISAEREEKRRGSEKTGSLLRSIIWFAIPLIMFLLHYYTQGAYDPRQGIVLEYVLSATAMTAILPVSLFLGRRFPGSSLVRAAKFIGVIVSVFWLSIPPLIWFGFLRYTHANPYEIMLLSGAVLLCAALLSTVYIWLIKRS